MLQFEKSVLVKWQKEGRERARQEVEGERSGEKAEAGGGYSECEDEGRETFSPIFVCLFVCLGFVLSSPG